MDWKQRVLRELLGLTERIALLEKEISNNKSEILVKQYEIMVQYQTILIERLDNELEGKVECSK